MSTASALHCPDCKAEIGPDLRTCVQCGADVGSWKGPQRAPLILPGNPALSVDVVRKRTSVPKIVAGTTVVAALVGAVLYYMPERESDDVRPVAVASAERADPDVGTARGTVLPERGVAPAASATESVNADSDAAYSYGDTAVSRPVPRTTTAAARVAAPTPRVVVPPPAAAVVPTRPTARSATPPPAPTRVAARTVARPTITPVFALTPLISSTLRPAERLQLRWTVTDRRTRRAVAGTRVEFTSTDAAVASVNPTSGLVVGRSPGTARIIVDAGAAGTRTVTLTVRPQAAPVVTVPPVTVPDIARSPVATTPPPTPAPASAPAPSREAARTDLPSDGEVRTLVDRFIRDVRRDAVRNYEVTRFLADGADHRVSLMGGPTVIGNTALGVRVGFAIRFTKFDGGGRPVARVAAVTMEVDKRDGQPSSSSIAIGALRRP